MDDRLRLSFNTRFDSLIAEVKAFWPDNAGEILGLLSDKLHREAAERQLENSSIKEEEEVKDEIVQAGPSTSRRSKRSQSSRLVSTKKKARHSQVQKRKKFACRFRGCGSSFDNDCVLAIHERIHLNIKPYRCTMVGCGYESTMRGNVVVHIRHVHWRIPRGTTAAEDDRDPGQYIAVNQELLARRLA